MPLCAPTSNLIVLSHFASVGVEKLTRLPKYGDGCRVFASIIPKRIIVKMLGDLQAILNNRLCFHVDWIRHNCLFCLEATLSTHVLEHIECLMLQPDTYKYWIIYSHVSTWNVSIDSVISDINLHSSGSSAAAYIQAKSELNVCRRCNFVPINFSYPLSDVHIHLTGNRY